MRNRRSFSILRFFSLALLLGAVVLTTLQLVRFSRIRANLPSGLRIANVSVGGLDRTQAAQRLLEAYSLPVELHYGDSIIQLEPAVIDFQLDTESMLAAAELERTQALFWQDFWDYLWGRTNAPAEVPLKATSSEARIRAFLKEVGERYDQPPIQPMPVAGTTNFNPGQPGSALDIDSSIGQIESAMRSLVNRSVDLPLQRTDPPRPAFQNLVTLLKQTIEVAEFDGLADVYLMDLQTAQEIHFAVQDGQDISVEPDIAYTASSIIKIPIMVSVFQRLNGNNDPEAMKLLEDMIDRSGNEAADWLMDRVIDPRRGPLEVSEDMEALGLKNTFLAGYFSLGSPILAAFQTPANSRADINTDPDPYSQTTPSDIGMLLTDLYQCAENGGSALRAVFGDAITQEECQSMITYLVNNKLPVLLTGGIPEGTRIGHKHGWVSTNGIINTIGDAGVIYTPGGNYVLVVFLHHPDQLVWDPASRLISELSKAVYNFYNLPIQ
jgi:beta-lactamase class A